jgi:hypothetical protein
VQTRGLHSLSEGLLPLCGQTLLQSEEVSDPKTINKKQYLSTTKFSENNRHCVIKFSQETQLYITKVFYKQFSCH